MRYGSVCSGVEAATLAWGRLGWKAVFYSEIEPFPAEVLKQRYPDVPNLGNMTEIQGKKYIGKIDLLTGGTPCQSFSYAGLRKGLDDNRGNLCLKFAELAHTSQSRWILWENVPGVLSSNSGSDFAGFLSLLCGWKVEVPKKGWRKAGIISAAPGGFGLAWRVLDAQYVRTDGYQRAVPQRRRRIFVVGYRGHWECSAAVLFDGKSMHGNTPPVRRTRQRTAGTSENSAERTGKLNGFNFEMYSGEQEGISPTLQANRAGDTLVYDNDVTCMAHGQSNAEICSGHAPTVNCRHEAPILFYDNHTLDARIKETNVSGTLTSAGDGAKGISIIAQRVTTAIAGNVINRQPGNGGNGKGFQEELSYTLTTVDRHGIAHRNSVRRLMPIECERLMGFPDDYTRISWKGKQPEDCPDSHRYKACGNSQCVNVMRWIGQRIHTIDKAVRLE